MRLRLLPLLSVALVLTACGGGNGSVTVASSSASSDTFDKDLCSEFEAEDGPSDKLLAGLPDRFDGAGTAIKDFVSTMDSMGDDENISVEGFATLLQKPEIGKQLKDLAAFAEKQCGESEGATTIGEMGDAADVASAKRDAAYCDALEAQFKDDAEGSDTSTAENLAALQDVAPEAHAEVWKRLIEVNEQPPADEDAGVFGLVLGLGVYAEHECKIDGALTQMLLGAMFMGLGDSGDSGDTTGTSGSDTSIPDIDPTAFPPADAAAVNELLGTSAGLTFEVVQADLDDDHEHLASMVVPVGWEAETGFDVSYSPPADAESSIFTSMDAGAGCDGLCGATDWETRLRGEGGKMAQFLSSHPSAAEAPIAGSEGAILTDTTDSVVGLIVRWDDRADKYFSCEIQLEDDQADLLSAFVTACESSRPAWFPVG